MQKFDCPLCGHRLNSFADFNLHALSIHKTKGYDDDKCCYLGAAASESENVAQINWDNWDCPVVHCKANCIGRSELYDHLVQKHHLQKVSQSTILKFVIWVNYLLF